MVSEDQVPRVNEDEVPLHVTLNSIQGPSLRIWMLNQIQHDVVTKKW